jgi:hypothetical protein
MAPRFAFAAFSVALAIAVICAVVTTRQIRPTDARRRLNNAVG